MDWHFGAFWDTHLWERVEGVWGRLEGRFGGRSILEHFGTPTYSILGHPLIGRFCGRFWMGVFGHPKKNIGKPSWVVGCFGTPKSLGSHLGTPKAILGHPKSGSHLGTPKKLAT
jgi:hypothetical protein